MVRIFGSINILIYLENTKCLNPWYKIGISSMKPNNPMIGKTFPIKEMKPINVHINVMIAIIMMTKVPFGKWLCKSGSKCIHKTYNRIIDNKNHYNRHHCT